MSQLSPGATVGRYRLTQVLRDGEGRQVYRAVDLAEPTKRTVVKIAALANSSDAARLQREYDVLRETGGGGISASCEHGVLLPESVAYLAMPDQGVSLATIIARAPGQRLPAATALVAMHATALALASLHERGWVHGDLKPGNVLCDEQGGVVLSDLEFASRIAAPARAEAEATADWMVVGTPPFVAPELWQRGVTGSPAADVWALGVSLYLALLCEYPFGDGGQEAIVAAIQRGLPPQVQQLPPPLRELLLTLLTVDPTRRPADGRLAANAIESTARQMGFDLAAARAALGRQAADSRQQAAPVEPGTQVAPLAKPEMITPTPRAGTVASSAIADMPTPPPAPRPGSASRRPEGIGAADSGGPSLLRRRAEFFDISSKAVVFHPPAPAGGAPPQPPHMPAMPSPARPTSVAATMPQPSAAAAAAPAPATPLTRRAAARWYRRMNPQRNFPLSVVFSGKQIRIVGGSGLGITLGQQEIMLDADDPVLAVEPRFPGCLISPPRAEVTVSQETTVCRFWITPLVCGDLPEACVTIRYRGKVVETLATPASVVTRTGAKVLGMLGLASPIASKALHLAGWDPDEMLERFMPYVSDLLGGLGLMRASLLLMTLLLAGAAGYFYVTRPLLSDEEEPELMPQGK